ncbi:hypothetical protein BO94DRAFT_530240 [Aspergillus sclerotioniger CBS 115572]|uniref:Uncharacterized protein n=1 Tax=Aspergillus sclerotioniger CBS 115572 TaxID=1450535 RepID=A0A317XA95_9EURO|nr:hypothetical protein BO94DRAFT_530240 [Aspergillus sclerotioniger CBS 115572]PWY95513.1 hypothetical protein BO94DRAFT_530240 [Aspergillus sclerotioniger CBS 115572]
MSILVSTFVTLPLLTLISVPLALSACITICFSILALILRGSLIYTELCFAIIANYFVVPMAPHTSLFNFSASEPTTPAASSTPKRRSIDHSIPGLLATHRQGYPFPRTQPRPPPHRTSSSTTSSSSTSPDNNNHQQHTPHRKRTPPHHTTPSALLTLISGDEDRDFEGLGGWRSATTKYLGHLSGTASPSPNDTTDESDERAWLSINRRLELPFQPLFPRNNSNLEPLDTLPWRHRQMASSISPPGTGGSGSHNTSTRHHHRSATTSLVSNRLSPNSSLPDSHSLDPHRRTISPSQQQQQNTLPCTPSPVEKFPSAPPIGAQGSSPPEAAGGYFALRPGSTASTSGSTTPVEERRSPRPSGRYMIHYPTGVRYRRRSMSGPNSGTRLTKSSAGTDRTL